MMSIFNWCRFELTPEEAGLGLTQFNLKDTILSDFCPADPICDEKTIFSPFRTIDGSCNNLKYPSWGKSRTQFQRALVPAYADGIHSITVNYKYVAQRKKMKWFNRCLVATEDEKRKRSSQVEEKGV